MTYKIYYQYYSYTLGCECCSDSSSDIRITGDGVDLLIESARLIEDEDELRDYIKKHYPQYEDFEVDYDYTIWF